MKILKVVISIALVLVLSGCGISATGSRGIPTVVVTSDFALDVVTVVGGEYTVVVPIDETRIDEVKDADIFIHVGEEWAQDLKAKSHEVNLLTVAEAGSITNLTKEQRIKLINHIAGLIEVNDPTHLRYYEDNVNSYLALEESYAADNLR